MTPLAILNTAICTTIGDYEVTGLNVYQARRIVADAPEILSAVGHQATADVLSELLGRPIPVNRIQFQHQHGQRALVFKLRGRPPEGVILTVAEMEAIGYDLWLMTRRHDQASAVLSDLDRCEHGRHSRIGTAGADYGPDVCNGCGGGSKGNPLWPHGIVGYELGGHPITLKGLATGDIKGARHEAMLALRERLVAEHPEITEPDDLAPRMGPFEGFYRRWYAAGGAR